MATCRHFLSFFVFALTINLGAGCGAKDSKHAATEGEKNIIQLGVLYQQFAATHNRAAHGINELKDYAKGLSADQKKTLGVAEGEEEKLFVSPRDHQEYALTKLPPGRGTMGISIYEQTGENGVRLGLTTLGQVMQIDEEGMDKIRNTDGQLGSGKAGSKR